MRAVKYRDALREALREEMLRDNRVFLLGEDIADPAGGCYAVTAGLMNEFGPERVRNTPLSEAAIIGAATGSSVTGMRPVAEIMYIDFMTICMDQVCNQLAKLRYMFGGQVSAPVVIRTQGGAGRSSAAQHAQSLEAWFCHVPGLKVAMPSTPYDAKGLLKAAIRDDDPVIFIEHKLLYNTEGPVPEGEYTIPLGQADIKREGSDVTVVAISLMVLKALDAAEELAGRGISVEVIDPRTLVPLDKETILASVRKTGRVVIVHEAAKRGGVGAELAAVIQEEGFDDLDAPVLRVAALNTPIPFAPELEETVIPGKDDIIQAVERLCA
jgi:pyruvate/2-oxoglutarate/acetoin dehydrogenase E1 component